MKIVHLVYSGIGGAGTVVLSLIKEDLKFKKNSSNVLFIGPKFSKIYKKILSNKKYFFIKTIKYLQFLSWLNIIQKLNLLKPDVIFLHNYQIIPSIIYCLIFKKKIIYVDHAAINYKTFRDKFIVKIIKAFLVDVIVLNNENYNYFKKNNINKNKLHLIPNGIDHNFFKKEKVSKNKKIFVIGMAGRLDYFKQHERLIKILSHKKLSSLNIKLSFAGDGPYANYLKKITKEYGVSKKVLFNGFLKDRELKNWFNKLNLYAHASSGEAMSTAILQAMSMGLPIIASNVNGIRDIFNKFPKIGKLFDNNNTNQISNLIYYYYKNKNHNKQKLSRKYIIENFTVKKMHNRYLKLAESISV